MEISPFSNIWYFRSNKPDFEYSVIFLLSFMKIAMLEYLQWRDVYNTDIYLYIYIWMYVHQKKMALQFK